MAIRLENVRVTNCGGGVSIDRYVDIEMRNIQCDHNRGPGFRFDGSANIDARDLVAENNAGLGIEITSAELCSRFPDLEEMPAHLRSELFNDIKGAQPENLPNLQRRWLTKLSDAATSAGVREAVERLFNWASQAF